MLTQGQVEDEIRRLSHRMENSTDRYAVEVQTAAEAEVEYKRRHHTAIIQLIHSGVKASVQEKESRAFLASADEYRAHKMTAAVLSATKEELVTLRHQIDALRTLAANIRNQT